MKIDDEQLLREGLQEGKTFDSMSKQDEIIFNILKWIFSALKKDQEIIEKKQVLEQLKHNLDTLQSLGFQCFNDFQESLTKFPT